MSKTKKLGTRSKDEYFSVISCDEELRLAVNTVKTGLAILQKSSPRVVQHFVVFLLLSTGLERIMKVLLALHKLNTEGQFPQEKYFRSFKHNLIDLCNEVEQVCYVQPPPTQMVAEDLDFLRSDSLVRDILMALSDFAERDRYIFLNGLSKEQDPQRWFGRRWSQLESAAATKEYRKSLYTDTSVYLNQVTSRLVGCIERLCRTLGHAAVWGLDQEAKSLGTPLYDFLILRNDELGKREYEVVNV